MEELKKWKKYSYISLVSAIISFVCVSMAVEGTIWEIFRIIFFICAGALLVCVIKYIITYKKENDKYPTIFTVICGIVIAIIICAMITKAIKTADEKSVKSFEQQTRDELKAFDERNSR